MVDGAAGIGSGGPGQDSQAARTRSKIGGLAAEERDELDSAGDAGWGNMSAGGGLRRELMHVSCIVICSGEEAPGTHRRKMLRFSTLRVAV